MDPYVPKWLRAKANASGNRVSLQMRVTNATVALVLAGMAFGAAVLNLWQMSTYAHEHAARMTSQAHTQADALLAVSTTLTNEQHAAETRLAAQYSQTERETRMLEYYLLELDAKVIKAGIKPASDSIAQKLEQQRKQQKDGKP